MVSGLEGRGSPFLKWAGGKRWLISGFGTYFPGEFGGYFEPFLGGGAVFFNMQPERAVLSDANEELINCYLALRDCWEEVYSLLRRHQRLHDRDHYYKVRASKPRSLHGRAAKFIYLNRTCWNGLYRVNMRGEFNVPIGTKTDVLMGDDFSQISAALQGVDLRTSDFESVINEALDGDFIFADPPYTVQHNLNGFVKYNEKIFSWADQIRLRDAVVSASHRGCRVMVTNANHKSVVDLYRHKGFELIALTRKSTIGGLGSERGNYEELIIKNF